MQLYNKEMGKKIFSHTWYIYPLAIGLIVVLWLWGFEAFHQPSAHQSLTIFFASQIKKDSFAKEIRVNHYDRENLREVSVPNALPSSTGFVSKLDMYLSHSDILVLDEKTIDDFKNYKDRFFVDIPQDIQNEYYSEFTDYYLYEDEEHVTHSYGIRIKKKGEASYLDDYMTFDSGYDYYACLSLSSQNLGKISGENNSRYDNALTFMKYLLKA